MPRAHRGGKEEIRASLLKPYLLRARAEKGEAVVVSLLDAAGIDGSSVDSETLWLSAEATKRILRGLRDLLGSDALESLGDWITHPEALGTRVRMLRVTRVPLDAYRYIVDNARETTRIGAWEMREEVGSGSATKKATAKSPTSIEKAAPTSEKPRDHACLTYRMRAEATDEGDPLDAAGEELLCASRRGELTSLPRIWGLADATVLHTSCIAKGDAACVYEVRWNAAESRHGLPSGVLVGGAISGLSVGLAGGWLAGSLGFAMGSVLGGAAGFLLDRSRNDRSARTFERNRILALERGLELRGELGSTPGDLSGGILGGKYRVGKKLGSGGIGVVYAAEHLGLGHEVAIKVLRGAAARDGGEIARLRREAYIQVHVDHPNVARVLDLDQMPDGSIYVVMEKLVGRSLADKLTREGLVAPGLAIPVFIGVCGALAAAHAKGVVHRDLKPGNIFLCDDGTSKVLDFGMSKLAAAESLTQAGYTLGTPEYMAPEQCIGATVEPRTDIYALGVLMYEALTGELPIVAQTRRELLDLHQRQVPQSIRLRRPDLPIPEALERAVMMCLRKRASDRPRNADELGAMLSSIPCEGLPVAYPPGVGRRPPRTEVRTARAIVSEAPPKA
jgi:eukaryotic-like serine/threonine-protein kinase